MQGVSGQVDAFAETPVDSERKVVVRVIRDPLPFQDELNDPRSSRLSEKVGTVHVEP